LRRSHRNDASKYDQSARARKRGVASLALMAACAIIPQLRPTVKLMKDVEVSDSIRFGEEAWVLVQRVCPGGAQPGIPAFDQVKVR
jgi:hypothetical protein